MEVKETLLRELVANEGMYITQNKELPASERIFVKAIWIAESDDPANWRDATEEEKLAHDKEVEELSGTPTPNEEVVE